MEKFKETKDSLKDFYEEFRSRLNNPFFASLTISWLFWNWRIPLVLFFYDRTDLIHDGYLSKAKYIVDHHCWLNIIGPVVIAGLYTWWGPRIKAMIIEHNASVLTESDSRILTITDESTLPFSTVAEIRREYKEKQLQLRNAIDEESQLRIENATLKSEIANEQIKVGNLDQDYTNLLERFQNLERESESLNGRLAILTAAHDRNNYLGVWSVVVNNVHSKWTFSDETVTLNNTIYKILFNALDVKGGFWCYKLINTEGRETSFFLSGTFPQFLGYNTDGHRVEMYKQDENGNFIPVS